MRFAIPFAVALGLVLGFFVPPAEYFPVLPADFAVTLHYDTSAYQVAGFVVGVMVVLVVTHVLAGIRSSKRKDRDKTVVDALKAEIRRLKQDIKDEKARVTRRDSTIRDLDWKVASLGRTIKAQDTEIQFRGVEIEELEGDNDYLEAKVKRRDQKVNGLEIDVRTAEINLALAQESNRLLRKQVAGLRGTLLVHDALFSLVSDVIERCSRDNRFLLAELRSREIVIKDMRADVARLNRELAPYTVLRLRPLKKASRLLD